MGMKERKPSASTKVYLFAILFVIVSVITVIVARQLTGDLQETATTNVSASPSPLHLQQRRQSQPVSLYRQSKRPSVIMDVLQRKLIQNLQHQEVYFY